MRNVLLKSLLVVLLICPTLSHARFDTGARPVAVQDRYYGFTNEFTFWGSFFPLDAFVKSVAPGFSYAYHFSDQFAVEFVRFNYLFGIDSGLSNDLKDEPYNVQAIPIPELWMVATTNFAYNALYGKFAFLNQYLVYTDIVLTGGGGAALYKHTTSEGVLKSTTYEVRPVIDLGLGLRFFFKRNVALRFDVRHFVSIPDIDNNLELALGVSTDLGWFVRDRDSD